MSIEYTLSESTAQALKKLISAGYLHPDNSTSFTSLNSSDITATEIALVICGSQVTSDTYPMFNGVVTLFQAIDRTYVNQDACYVLDSNGASLTNGTKYGCIRFGTFTAANSTTLPVYVALGGSGGGEQDSVIRVVSTTPNGNGYYDGFVQLFNPTTQVWTDGASCWVAQA